jgi:hypothetical protein
MQYQTRQGQFKLELQNCSGKLKTGKLFTTRSLKEEIELIYKGENIDGYDYSMEFNFEVANNMDEVKDSDHLVVFADVTEPGGNEIFGSTNQLGGRVLFVSAARFEKKPWGAPDGSKTVAHELGHLLNLPHVTGGVFSGNYLNLMHEVPESYIDAKSVSADQFQAIAKSYHNGFLNNGANHDANGMPLVGSARGIIWSGDAISRRKKPKK